MFSGPPESILEPGRENKIPAPVLERSVGVAFLHTMGLPLPPRVAERVQTLPLSVTIQCELTPNYPGSRTEDCVLRIFAEAPDGYREQWIGQKWRRETEGSGSRGSSENSKIIIYDRSGLAKRT